MMFMIVSCCVTMVLVAVHVASSNSGITIDDSARE
jgi:hypothetical protein